MELRSRRKCLSSEKSDKREEEESVYSLSSDSDDENDLWDEMEEANKVKVLDLNGEPSESSDVCYVAETSAKKRKRSDAKKESVGPSHQEKEMHREDDGSSDESADSLSSPITSRVNLPMQEYSWRSYKEAKKKRGKKKRGKKKREIALKWEIWEKELDAWIKENSGQDLDLDNLSERVNEITEAPSDVVIPLLRYQKEWLSWALKQERSEARGGILADEMGMGKTIQAIALVLAKRENSRHVGQPGGEEETSAPTMDLLPGLFQKLPKIKATLVICPVVAVSQWVNEINRFTAEGSTKVLIYHGAKRGKSLHEFSKYDFVITTYSTVENEYRRNIMPPKKACCYCGKLFLNEKLSYHQKYFCGPSAVKTTKQSKQETKGKRKMEKTVEGRRPRARKTGKDQKGFKEDMDSDSSSGVENTNSLKKGLSSPPVNSILHTVKWERIILDEAHSIKDRRCNTAKAVFALVSLYKWALSGTPLQNRVGELYSLIRLLQIVPYSYYFCKDCDCMTLDYSTTKDCKSCQHSATRHFCWWNKFVAKPIQVSGGSGDGKNAMILLRHKILKTILLRRTKKSRAADLALPPRIVSLRRDTMDIKEEDYYTSLYNESQSQFNTYVQAGTLLNNYAHVFDLLTRLRQAVNHPYLVVYSRVAAMRNEMMNNSSKSEVCGLCAEQGEDIVVTGCEHVFCKMCLIDFTSGQEQASCPSCSKPMTVDLSTSVDFRDQAAKASIKGFRAGSILNRIQLDDFQTSTKIDALREEIRFMIERDGSAKGIVFSQFTSFLDLINYSLQKSGISTVQLVGSMTMSARDAAIKRFIEDPECKIFLMSLKAGGVALNLTVASHVFLMDPWWNPAVERQAQDRIHRIGQYKPIRIVRFVIKDTIEERILRLQEKKEQLFDGTIGGDTEAMGKLSVTDLKFLFVT